MLVLITELVLVLITTALIGFGMAWVIRLHLSGRQLEKQQLASEQALAAIRVDLGRERENLDAEKHSKETIQQELDLSHQERQASLVKLEHLEERLQQSQSTQQATHREWMRACAERDRYVERVGQLQRRLESSIGQELQNRKMLLATQEQLNVVDRKHQNLLPLVGEKERWLEQEKHFAKYLQGLEPKLMRLDTKGLEKKLDQHATELRENIAAQSTASDIEGLSQELARHVNRIDGKIENEIRNVLERPKEAAAPIVDLKPLHANFEEMRSELSMFMTMFKNQKAIDLEPLKQNIKSLRQELDGEFLHIRNALDEDAKPDLSEVHQSLNQYRKEMSEHQQLLKASLDQLKTDIETALDYQEKDIKNIKNIKKSDRSYDDVLKTLKMQAAGIDFISAQMTDLHTQQNTLKTQQVESHTILRRSAEKIQQGALSNQGANDVGNEDIKHMLNATAKTHTDTQKSLEALKTEIVGLRSLNHEHALAWRRHDSEVHESMGDQLEILESLSNAIAAFKAEHGLSAVHHQEEWEMLLQQLQLLNSESVSAQTIQSLGEGLQELLSLSREHSLAWKRHDAEVHQAAAYRLEELAMQKDRGNLSDALDATHQELLDLRNAQLRWSLKHDAQVHQVEDRLDNLVISDFDGGDSLASALSSAEHSLKERASLVKELEERLQAKIYSTALTKESGQGRVNKKTARPKRKPAKRGGGVPLKRLKSGLSKKDVIQTMKARAPKGKKDALQKIYGIGPKLEKILNGLGIVSFEQIAKLSAKDVEAIKPHLSSFKNRIDRDNWVGGAAKTHLEVYGKRVSRP